MKYKDFAKKFEEARMKAVADNTCIFTSSQKKIPQPIEEDGGLYDYIFSQDFITNDINVLDELIEIDRAEKQVENIFVQRII